VDRTDLFKISDFILGGKEIVTSLYSSLEKTDRQTDRQTVYGAYSELRVSPFFSVKINGLGNFFGKWTLYTSTVFGHLKSCGVDYRVSQACILRKTSRTRKGFTRVTTRETELVGANGGKVLKILTFGPIRKWWNLTLSQLGTIKIFKGGWIWNGTSFGNLTKASILFSTQYMIICVRNTEASSAYIFNGASIHANICKL